MPGVVDGQQYWNEQESQIRGFVPQSHQRAMSPYRHENDNKVGPRSHHSNGFNSDPQNEFVDDGATYLLEHLATFSVGNQYGLVTPKDGLRRLLQMEKSSGIWTQKMQMRLERNWVIIIDYENGDVVERFPMNLISDPTAYTSDDRRELYNNILIFIVREDPKSKNHNPSEMHIFQCAQVSAQDVVDEIKMFITGKGKSRYKDNMRHLPPPPTNPPPDPPVNGLSGISVREQVNMFNAAAAASSSQYSPPHRELGDSQHGPERSNRSQMFIRESNDETSSTTSDKYERDVAVLNHCFDDIERFIARLQHAAAAYKELERRQKSRKNKKKDMGDGMLSIRAKPPPEKEFLDILQKFKLSFNLLAKLKSHIHDPNAPELVHFLFTPLALIVDAAKDSNYSSNLASRVVAPLLTRDAIDLLTNCCTSKETDLWHSLGEAWTVPRGKWKDYEKEYHPVFSDGWAPEYPSFEDSEVPDIPAGAVPLPGFREEVLGEEPDYPRTSSREEKTGRYDSEYFYSNERHGNRDRSISPPGVPDNHSHPIYESRRFEHHEETRRREYSADRDRRFMPTLEHDYRDSRDRDMRSDFSADSIEHSTNSDPHKQFEWQQKQWLEELKSQGARIVQVVYPRTANNDKELTVTRGEYLEILDDSRKWWKAKNMHRQVAHVPHTIVTPYNGGSTEDDVFNNPLYAAKGTSRETSYSTNESPSAKGNFEEPSTTATLDSSSRKPPSIPPPTPASADWVRRERQGKKEDKQALMTESTAVQTDSEETEILPIEVENNFEESPKQMHSKAVQRSETMIIKEAQKQIKEVVQSKQEQQPSSKLNRWMCLEHNKPECSYLKMDSNSAEVQHWLDVKGFSEKTQAILDSVSGEMLFSLSKQQLEKYLGDEGCRLFSHLTIQKNISGVKTTRSAELKNVLSQRRKLIDATVKKADDPERSSAKERHANESAIPISGDEKDKDEGDTIEKQLAVKLLNYLAKQTEES